MTTLGMASCASDETTSVLQDDAIEFRTGIGATSRAAETTVTNLNNGFKVLALSSENSTKTQEFLDVFKKNGTTWTSETTHNWPKHRLDFYAYYPYSGDAGTDVGLAYTGTATPTIQNFVPASDPKDQVDFVYATNGGLRSDFTSIPLFFKHALSQIVFKAKNTNAGYTIYVKGVRIGKVKTSADFKFPASKTESGDQTASDIWTFKTDLGKYESIFSTDATSAEFTLGTEEQAINTSGSFMILPQDEAKWTPDEGKDGAYLALLIKIVGTGKTTEYSANQIIYPSTNNTYKPDGTPDGYGWAAVPIDAKWEPGKKYTYVLDFSQGAGKVDPEKPEPETDSTDPFGPGDDILNHPIEFTVTVESWTALNEVAADMNEAITTSASTNSAPAQTNGN
jgi:hypothetical protein